MDERERERERERENDVVRRRLPRRILWTQLVQYLMCRCPVSVLSGR